MKKLSVVVLFLFVALFFLYPQSFDVSRARYNARTPGMPELLLKVYAAADQNHDSNLTISEMRAYFKTCYAGTSYKTNDVALDPLKFFLNRGGDCEDYAIYAADTLYFNGFEAYVGVVTRPEWAEAHAVCLVRMGSVLPKGTFGYIVGEKSVGSPGAYMVIDYDFVGEFSEARFYAGELVKMYRAHELWGKKM